MHEKNKQRKSSSADLMRNGRAIRVSTCNAAIIASTVSEKLPVNDFICLTVYSCTGGRSSEVQIKRKKPTNLTAFIWNYSK